MKPDRRSVLFGAATCAALLSNGCVEPFPGSNIQITFGDDTHIPGDANPAEPDDRGRPPAGTHYMFVGVRGADVVDDEADPETQPGAVAFEVAEFDIVPIIDPDDPCFIERERSFFPGLHATQIEAKWREELELPAPAGGEVGPEFDPDTPMQDAVRVLTAARRVSSQRLISNTLKAVVAHTPFEPPAAGPVCADAAGYDPEDIPPPECLDEDSNAARLALCTALFDQHPNYYVGNDEVLSFPINGEFLGAVEGTDPRNNQPYGGAQFFVPTNLDSIDGLLVNYQYDCALADFEIDPDQCAPQVPAGVQPSSIGFHYMAGTPQTDVQRGVARVSLRNRIFQQLINAEAAIYSDLDDDNVSF